MKSGVPSVLELRARLSPVLKGVLESVGRFGDLSVLHKPTDGTADNPVRFLVVDTRGKPIAVLALSQPIAPNYAAEEIERASRAKDALGKQLGTVILDPLCVGELDGLTYNMTPWRRPLSRMGWLRRIQTAVLAPSLFRWLRRAADATLTVPSKAEIDVRFLGALTHIVTHLQLSEEVRRRAGLARDRLLSGDWQPKCMLDHNDLWLGNILLDLPNARRTPGLTRRFVIIDWRGANPGGYGISDLLGLASSVGIGSSHLARELYQHCEILGCSLSDSMSQLLAGLGHLGMNLECFPVDRYVALVERSYRTLSEVVER